MPVTIFNNDIPDPRIRQMVQRIVIEEIGDRAGDWIGHIHEHGDSPAWTIRITGPEGFNWKEIFDGPAEQDPEGNFIRAAVRTALSGE
jgi:hypothetical protein